MYLFDTDIIIDYLQDKGDGAKIVKSLIGKEISISVITWAEILRGIKDAPDYVERMGYLNEFVNLFKCNLLPIDKITIEQFVDLQLDLKKKGKVIADFDLFIAAAAIASNLTLVTRNKKHFTRIKNLKLF